MGGELAAALRGPAAVVGAVEELVEGAVGAAEEDAAGGRGADVEHADAAGGAGVLGEGDELLGDVAGGVDVEADEEDLGGRGGRGGGAGTQGEEEAVTERGGGATVRRRSGRDADGLPHRAEPQRRCGRGRELARRWIGRR